MCLVNDRLQEEGGLLDGPILSSRALYSVGKLRLQQVTLEGALLPQHSDMVSLLPGQTEMQSHLSQQKFEDQFIMAHHH